MIEVEEEQQEESKKALRGTESLLPGALFYTERIEIPAGVTTGEIESAIEMQLEANAPFPLDQLNFGVLLDHESGQAFVYAVLKDKLKELELTNDSSVAHFPCFLPFLGFKAEKPCVLTGLAENQLCLMVYDQAGMLPSESHCISLDCDFGNLATIEKIRADLLRDLPWIQYPLEDKLFVWESSSQNWKNERIMLSRDASGAELCLELDAVEASFADVREQALKQKALKAARFNRVLWFTTTGSAGGLFLVALLALGNLFWSLSIQSRLELVAARQATVESIESKERNLQVFESGSAAQLQPLSMLDIVNEARPDGVYFGEVRAFEGNKLQVDGMAEENGTALINRFRDELNKLDQLESVSVEITRINQGASYFFRANLEFKELELANVGDHS